MAPSFSLGLGSLELSGNLKILEASSLISRFSSWRLAGGGGQKKKTFLRDRFVKDSFSRMRSESSRFTWGSGGEAVFAKFCVCDRNRRQPSASVRNRLRDRRKALHSGERVRRGPESVSN